jgi:hypothetical protein
MASEAPVYRSSRLHATNPTAAISEDTSYLYTLVGCCAVLCCAELPECMHASGISVLC